MLSFTQLKESIAKNELLIFGIFAILLAFPAFFINLGITPFNEDESTRALVTLEMDISHQYVTPTVGGSYYYNKPPLFNWIVLQFFRAGGYNELMVRLPTVISLLLFSLTIFLMVKKHTGKRIAFISALFFLTCGRILTYESLKGLIDILFCWILFVNFMVLYDGIKRQKYLSAFVISYLLLFLAYMFKGLPALVFQAFTVLFLLFYWQRWKLFRVIFSYKHLLGLFIFILLTGAYYLTYFHFNPGSSNEMIAIIFQQSARRTAIRFGLWAMIVHLFTYPFEFFGHFMPWTILVIYFFKKGNRQLLSNQFISCCLWAFFINISVYWASPESFARYVLMLVPMVYIVLVYLSQQDGNVNWMGTKFIYYLFFACIALLVIATLSIPFLSATSHRPFVVLKTLFLLGLFAPIVYLYWKQPRNMLIYVPLFLLVVRIGFNWFVLTHRVDHNEDILKRTEALKIGKFARTHEVYVYGQPVKYFNEDAKTKYISFFTRFYIDSEAQKMIIDSNIIQPNCYYLVRSEDVAGKQYIKYSEIGVTLDKEPRFLVQFK